MVVARAQYTPPRLHGDLRQNEAGASKSTHAYVPRVVPNMSRMLLGIDRTLASGQLATMCPQALQPRQRVLFAPGPNWFCLSRASYALSRQHKTTSARTRQLPGFGLLARENR